MSEYKEIRFRLYFNLEKPEQKDIYEILSGCQSATERNKLLMQILVNHFAENDLPDAVSPPSSEKKKAGDVNHVIDYLYEHIRTINERLITLEKAKASEPEVGNAVQAVLPGVETNNTDVSETKVLPMEAFDTPDLENTVEQSEPDIEIPDDILDYLNNLK